MLGGRELAAVCGRHRRRMGWLGWVRQNHSAKPANLFALTLIEMAIGV